MELAATAPGYSHTQKAALCLILYGSALLCFALGWMVGDTPGVAIAIAVGVVIALLGPAFHHVTVEDQGDRLAIRFGPVPLVLRIGTDDTTDLARFLEVTVARQGA